MKKTKSTKSISLWLTLWFLAVLLLTLLVSAGWNYYSTRQAILDREETSVRYCADIIKGMIDHYGLEALDSRTHPESAAQLRHPIREYCESFEQDLLFILAVDPETEEVTTLVSVAAGDEADAQAETRETGTPAVRIDPGSMLDRALSGGEEIFRNVYPQSIVWYVPYRNAETAETAVIVMESPIDVETKMIVRDFLMDILVPVGTMTLGFLGLLAIVRRRIARPLKEISGSMNRFARDSRTRPEPISIRSRDEIGEIARSYEKMTEDISAYLNNIENLTRERVQAGVEMEVARRIQYGLVPERTRLDGPGFGVCAMTRPAREVGGDFYDCFRRDDGSVCAVMGDVSGKGISAAIFMAMAKTMLREKLLAGLSPAEALNQANDALCAQNPEGLFATVFIAVIRLSDRKMTYANAGHTRPVLLEKEASFLSPESGMALGLFEDAGIRDETCLLPPGGGILLYTDGVTEALNPQREFFGEERLLDTLKGMPEGTDAEGAVLCVSRMVHAFCGGSEPFDDMAVLALLCGEKNPGEGRSLPVALSAFDTVKKEVIALAGDTPETRRALVACDEALANIVSYSGAESLFFSCEMQGDYLRVSFSDDGAAFDPTAARAEEKSFDRMDRGGMGLDLIRQTVTSMAYERKEGRNELTLYF